MPLASLLLTAMGLKVFKFGGASVKDAAGMRNVTTLAKQSLLEAGHLVCVVSATGKTTNALENVVKAAYETADPLSLLDRVITSHRAMATELCGETHPVHGTLLQIRERIRTLLQSATEFTYDALYDSIVSEGERLATAILSAYWENQGLPHVLFDARTLIRTNLCWREGEVDWGATQAAVTAAWNNLQNNRPGTLLLTQGFIGGGPKGESVTLGREGSDYSAALLGAALGAESVTIWKDVAGVFNADPKQFPDAVMFARLSYDDALELACYGATVIHPKTLFPLKKAGIPLYVKSFDNPSAPGTRIDEKPTMALVPALIFKPRQVLWTLQPQSGHFIQTAHLNDIFQCAARHRLKINALQHTAMEVSLCLEEDTVHLREAQAELGASFRIELSDSVSLVTIINYSPALVEAILGTRKPLLEQRSLRVARFVVEGAPLPHLSLPGQSS